MTKRTVDHHASIVIVYSGDRFFFNGYDSGYPTKEWIGFLNPLGGNYEHGDISPLFSLEREVSEEMTDKEKRFKNFATQEAEILKNHILIHVTPYQDFVILNPIVEKNKSDSREKKSAIVSFYYSVIPKDLIDNAAEVLKSGKRLVSEGDGGSVVSLDDILSGKRYLAWANPFMIKYFLNNNSVPYLREGEAEPIGKPRPSFSDYLSDFEYLKKLSQPL
jgi:hypothetical protein